MTDNPTLPLVERLRAATEETQRLQQELDITNADHIALWLEANTIPDEPMNQCISWLACRIVDAHEAAAAIAQRRVSELEALLVRTQETIRDAANGEEPRFGELWRAIDAALAKDETARG